jgi:D-sedoheptulose 7-phosphate isomerase
MLGTIGKRFTESAEAMAAAGANMPAKIAEAAELLIACLKGGGRVYVFGNGGSAADAQHIACELVGRFQKERRALAVLALSTDSSALTCIGNDYSFEQVFSRQVEAFARPGDVAIGLSTSGNSLNVVAALRRARELGIKTIAMTGEGGGKCAAWADVLLAVPCRTTPRVQEVHALVYHILCELVEEGATK